MPKQINHEREKELALIRAMPPIKFSELEDKVNSWMMQADPHALKIMAALVIANKLPGDPVWMFIVGPSSGGKTMMLSLLNKLEETYPLSSLTPNTLVSGQRGNNGLLFDIDKMILTFKDFTTVLQLYQEARNEIMSQLREVYDGAFKKTYGTGENRDWTGKIGFIAGVTTVVDMTSQLYSALGERFIQYRLITPDRKEVAMFAINSSSKKKSTQADAKKEVQEYFARYIHGVKESMIDDDEVVTSTEQRTRLIRITNFATLARSPIMRDSSPRREIYFKPASEMPARFTQQLNHLCMALMIMNRYETGEAILTDDDELAIYKIALDSIPMMRRTVLQKVTEYDSTTAPIVAALTGFNTGVARQQLEDLNMLGIIDRVKDEKKRADEWRIKDEFRGIMEEYDHIVPVSEEEQAIKMKEFTEIEQMFNEIAPQEMQDEMR